MKVLSLTASKLLQNSQFCLGGIVLGLTVLHLLVSWRVTGDSDRLITNSLYWSGIIGLLWRKRYSLNLESGIVSSFFGFLLIILVLSKSVSLFWFETSFLKLAPLLLALGLGILASGFKGLKQYWRELAIVLLLSIPDSSAIVEKIEAWFQVTIWTAKFATLFLWYLGFEASGSGVSIMLSNGAVKVLPACTGIDMAIVLLKLGLVFILVFPSDWRKKILLLIEAVCIAFLSGGLRVALMAAVVSNRESFNYWHGDPGNQIFSTAALLIFGILCHLSLPSPAAASSESRELQKQL